MAFQVSQNQLAGGDTQLGIPTFGFQKMEIVKAGSTHTCHSVALAFFTLFCASAAAALFVLGGHPVQPAYVVSGVLCALAALGFGGSSVYLSASSMQDKQLLAQNITEAKKKMVPWDEMLKNMRRPSTEKEHIRGALVTFSPRQRDQFTQTIYQGYSADQNCDDLKILIACAAFPETFESLPFLDNRALTFSLLENFERNGITEAFLTKIGEAIGLPISEAESLSLARYSYFRTKNEKMALALLSYLPQDWPGHADELSEIFETISESNGETMNRHPQASLRHLLSEPFPL